MFPEVAMNWTDPCCIAILPSPGKFLNTNVCFDLAGKNRLSPPSVFPERSRANTEIVASERLGFTIATVVTYFVSSNVNVVEVPVVLENGTEASRSA
jgi:hypothetical protein